MKPTVAPEAGMANDVGDREHRTEETREGVLAGIPESMGAVAARPPVTAVIQTCLLRIRSGDAVVDRNVRIGDIVRAALSAGLSVRDVAMGTMLGVLRAAPAAGGPEVDVRGTAATVLAATSYYGGRVRQAIRGILAAAILHAEDRGDAREQAVAEARRGIIEAVENDIPAGTFEV